MDEWLDRSSDENLRIDFRKNFGFDPTKKCCDTTSDSWTSVRSFAEEAIVQWTIQWGEAVM